MPPKPASLRTAIEEPVAIDTAGVVPAQNQEAKRSAKKASGSLDDLSRTALKAFLIARDAASNVRDLLTHSSRMAFLAIKDCEKELDIIERFIDERLPAAITRAIQARPPHRRPTLR